MHPGERTVAIGDALIGEGHPAWIVAELGVNHDGSVERARQLVRLAARAGADAVKVQCFEAALLASPGAPLSAYQRASSPAADQCELLDSLALPPPSLILLAAEAHELGMQFFASPFDPASLSRLVELRVPAIKLGSGELTNVALLRGAAATGLPLLLSTGMADWTEIERALAEVRGAGAADPILLHCVTSYPTPLGEANVRAVAEIAERTGCLAGYSDHTLFDEPSLAARALGACVLERHLTYARDASGPDHATSLEPEAFGHWVAAVRRLEQSLGDGEKRHRPLEAEARRTARKSIVAAQAIPGGARIAEGMVVARRPGDGIGAEQWDRVVGARALRPIAEGTAIREEDIACNR